MDGPSYMRQVAMLIANEAANKHRLASGQPAEMFVGGPRAAQEPGTPDAWDRTFAQLNDKALPIPPGAEFVKRTQQQAVYPADAMKSTGAVGKAVPSFDGVPKEDVQLPAVTPLQSGPIFAQPADAPLPRPIMQPGPSLKNPTGEMSPYADAMAANEYYWKGVGQNETGVAGVDGLERIKQQLFNPDNGYGGIASQRERTLLAMQEQARRTSPLLQQLQDKMKAGQFESAQQNALTMNAADNASREKIAGMHYSPDALRGRAIETIVGGGLGAGRDPEEIAGIVNQYDSLLKTRRPADPAAVIGPPSDSPSGQPPASQPSGGPSTQPGAEPPPSPPSVTNADESQLKPLLNRLTPMFGDGKTPVEWNRKRGEQFLDLANEVNGLSPAAQSALLRRLAPKIGDINAFGDAIAKSLAKSYAQTIPLDPYDGAPDTLAFTDAGFPFQFERGGDTVGRSVLRSLGGGGDEMTTYSRAKVGNRIVPLDVGDLSRPFTGLYGKGELEAEKQRYNNRGTGASAILRLLREKYGYGN